MRATYLALRLLTAGCLLTGVTSCAQGGIDDDELNNVGSGDDDDSPRGDAGTSSKDAGKDARASSGDDDDDEPPVSTNKDAGVSSGSKDASTGTTTGSKDAGGGTATTGGAKIKCPSPMVCDATLSTFLSLIDMSIKSGDSLCATTGGVLPASVSCTTADTCKSARLTTATCVAGSCIQPCTQ